MVGWTQLSQSLGFPGRFSCGEWHSVPQIAWTAAAWYAATSTTVRTRPQSLQDGVDYVWTLLGSTHMATARAYFEKAHLRR